MLLGSAMALYASAQGPWQATWIHGGERRAGDQPGCCGCLADGPQREISPLQPWAVSACADIHGRHCSGHDAGGHPFVGFKCCWCR
jgi:hypothetical protein